MKNYCARCRTRIKSHLWIIDEVIYCGASCQRGGKSQFESIRKALNKMFKENDTG